ncbi:MAG TPA: hypothetical protein VF820_00305 [Patescibacteria group bacterium]
MKDILYRNYIKNISKIVYLTTGVILLFSLKIYFDRIVSFSFGDEWNTFILAYFMQKGKVLYSEIFTNHQMLIAYISYFLEIAFHPNTLYKLVFIHRASLILYGFIFDILFLIRFKKKAAGFVITYELTKYYLFGNIFLAESFIVYPLVYLFFLGLEKIKLKKIYNWEIIFAGIITWFVLFMREPYIPLVLFLYISLLIKFKNKKILFSSIILCIFLSIITLLTVPFKDYLQDVFLFNFSTIIPYEAKSSGTSGIGIVKILFYPIFILFWGKWNYFREVLIGGSTIYILFSLYLLFKKKFAIFFYSFIILTLAAVRVVAPGTMFYEAFHMVIWYALFIVTIVYFLSEIAAFANRKIKFISLGIFLLWLVFLFSPKSFIWENIDKNIVFTINYAQYYTNGEVIHQLSSKNDTLFADLWDYLIYWQANLSSPYKYSIYTFVMQGYKPFQDARMAMFKTNPPDFYYTFCPKGVYASELLPDFVKNKYIELNHNNMPSCLYIKKSKLASISKDKWSNIAQLGFSLPQ